MKARHLIIGALALALVGVVCGSLFVLLTGDDPLHPDDDLVPAPVTLVPPDQNAYVLLHRACESLQPGQPYSAWRLVESYWDEPLEELDPPPTDKQIDALLRSNEPLFDGVRQALGCQTYQAPEPRDLMKPTEAWDTPWGTLR